MAYKLPPNDLENVLEAVMWILSGIDPGIKVDYLTKDPLEVDWVGCRKMAGRNASGFRQFLLNIFDC